MKYDLHYYYRLHGPTQLPNKPYKSYLTTEHTNTKLTNTVLKDANLLQTKSDVKSKKSEDESVYILYGIVYSNGSEPVIASNIHRLPDGRGAEEPAGQVWCRW